MTDPSPKREFVYVGDPMCSWCWGFAPTLDTLRTRYRLPMRVIVGGLRPADSHAPVDDTLAEYLANHWRDVEKASGQPFDHSLLERRDWQYHTELACAAVVAMREHRPLQELRWFTYLQHAFYAEGKDLTAVETYAELAEGWVDDPVEFAGLLGAQAWRNETRKEFDWAKKMGVTGFPTLLLREDDKLVIVTKGWMAADDLVPALDRYLGRSEA